MKFLDIAKSIPIIENKIANFNKKIFFFYKLKNK